MDLYPRPNNPVPLEWGRLERMYGYLWADDVRGYLDIERERTKGATL